MHHFFFTLLSWIHPFILDLGSKNVYFMLRWAKQKQKPVPKLKLWKKSGFDLCIAHSYLSILVFVILKSRDFSFTFCCIFRYPTATQKTALAKSIVSAYPTTKDTTPGLQGHVSILWFCVLWNGYRPGGVFLSIISSLIIFFPHLFLHLLYTIEAVSLSPSCGYKWSACSCIGHYAQGAACHAAVITRRRGDFAAYAWRSNNHRSVYPQDGGIWRHADGLYSVGVFSLSSYVIRNSTTIHNREDLWLELPLPKSTSSRHLGEFCKCYVFQLMPFCTCAFWHLFWTIQFLV